MLTIPSRRYFGNAHDGLSPARKFLSKCVVSFRQARMNGFGLAGSVAVRILGSWRTADAAQQTTGSPGRFVTRSGALGRWRQGRKRGDRIPAALWGEAVELAGRYGVNRTAQTLGLDYYHLKKRVKEKTSPRTGPRKSAADVRFEELPASAFAAPLECIIQFENSGADDCGSSGGEARPRMSQLWDATSGESADAAAHSPDADSGGRRARGFPQRHRWARAVVQGGSGPGIPFREACSLSAIDGERP